MSDYRFDKSFFKAQSFEEADKQKNYWLQKDAKERIGAAWQLISGIYGFSIDDPPRIDKSVFRMRKHKN